MSRVEETANCDLSQQFWRSVIQQFDGERMPLTEPQYQGLFWVGAFASLASIFGSSIIVYNTKRRREESMQQRLLLALSINDLLASLNSFTLPVMIPKGTEGHYWASGNGLTCTISGFLSVTFFVSVMYSPKSGCARLLSRAYETTQSENNALYQCTGWEWVIG